MMQLNATAANLMHIIFIYMWLILHNVTVEMNQKITATTCYIASFTEGQEIQCSSLADNNSSR
jgi:hypothetical protein